MRKFFLEKRYTVLDTIGILFAFKTFQHLFAAEYALASTYFIIVIALAVVSVKLEKF